MVERKLDAALFVPILAIPTTLSLAKVVKDFLILVALVVNDEVE